MIRTILFAAGILLFAAACNAPKEGKTPGGFKYIHHIDEDGPVPQAGEYVYFQVLMSNGDSTLFDSYTQPDMPLVLIPSAEEMKGQRPSPVLEALMMMSAGDSLTVYYPVDSLGPQRPQGFENAEFVIYNIAVKEIKSSDEYKTEESEKQAATEVILQGVREQTKSMLDQFKAKSFGDKLITTASGLQYVLIEEGTGEVASPGKTVDAQYFGVLMDGTEFDNSYSRGKPFSFQAGLGQVIPGWDEAFTTLKNGTKAVLFVPSKLGYGDQGNEIIPANSDLVFYVEIQGVK